MLGTALLIGAALLILGGSIVGLIINLRRRMDQATSGPDEGQRERAEALRQISREIDRGKSAHRGFY
jgi:hypothetical protein